MSRHPIIERAWAEGGRAISVLALCGLGMTALAQSLYDESTFQSLTADRRALKVGDSITVQVLEDASATASANTTTSKSGGLTAGLKGVTMNHSGSLTLGEDFGGAGTVQRAGRV